MGTKPQRCGVFFYHPRPTGRDGGCSGQEAGSTVRSDGLASVVRVNLACTKKGRRIRPGRWTGPVAILRCFKFSSVFGAILLSVLSAFVRRISTPVFSSGRAPFR